MCEFISWVEKRGKVYFLTGAQLLSEKGQTWCKENHVSKDDYCGHGTVRLWYGIDAGDGVDKECVDFSKPSNFPDTIVKALKAGEMAGLSLSFPQGLLSKPIADDHDAKRKLLGEDYRAKRELLDEDYRAKLKLLADDYWAKRELLDEDCWKLFTLPENRAEEWK